MRTTTSLEAAVCPLSRRLIPKYRRHHRPMDSRMGMSQLQTIKIDGMSREETTVRSLTPPEGHEDERLESSAVGISRLDPRSGTRRVALCGRRGVRTAVPALARVGPRYTGRSEIAALVRQLLKLYPN